MFHYNQLPEKDRPKDHAFWLSPNKYFSDGSDGKYSYKRRVPLGVSSFNKVFQIFFQPGLLDFDFGSCPIPKILTLRYNFTRMCSDAGLPYAEIMRLTGHTSATSIDNYLDAHKGFEFFEKTGNKLIYFTS